MKVNPYGNFRTEAYEGFDHICMDIMNGKNVHLLNNPKV